MQRDPEVAAGAGSVSATADGAGPDGVGRDRHPRDEPPKGAPPTMSKDTPLAALLVRSHAALVLLLIAALAVPIAGLLYTRSLLSRITDVELIHVDAEEAIHRAAWQVEVAARHASRRCLVDPGLDPGTVVPSIVAADAALGAALARDGARATPRLLRAARRYREIVAGASTDTCRVLARVAADRLALDEELTDAWIDRLRALHRSISASEREARRTAAGASAAALLFGILGVTTAALVARGAARRLGRPLAAAAATAVRLGRGDFSPIDLGSGGVREIGELADALARMGRELGALDRMKQQLLASVSHELHTPLAKMREALGLLADGTAGPLSARQARVVQLARDACERELRTVGALLDTSRLRSGQRLRTQSGVAIDDVLRAAVDDERADAEERQVRVTLALEGGAPSLTLDVALVERAVANLVRNAVSVSAPGGVVEVRRRRDGRGVRVEVADRGPGLPAALGGDPFRAFQSAAVGARGAGLGLGLALARDVARAHGGDLVVARSGPDGTCFAFLLPTAEAQDAAP